jgi:hypothetical protein
MDPDQPVRLDARDRALRRASVTTGWVAVGGIAVTAVAAVVFAQPSAAAATATDPGGSVSEPDPSISTGPMQVPTPAAPLPAAPPSTSHAAHDADPGSVSSGSGGDGSGRRSSSRSGSVLQPPAAAPQPSPARHAHISSGAS